MRISPLIRRRQCRVNNSLPMTNQSINIPYLILTGALALAVIVVFTIFKPLLTDITRAQTDMQNQQAVLEQKQDFLHNLDQKKAFLNNQTDVEKKLAAMLPADDQMEDVIRILQIAATESGGILNTIKNETNSIKGKADAKSARGGTAVVDVDLLGFGLQFQGSYQQTRAFIGKITASPRLLDITTMTLRRDTQNPELIITEMNIHFYKEKVVQAKDI